VSVKTVFHREGYERTQDVEDIIERNKKLQNETQDRKSGFRHIASIPNIILEKWLREEWARGNVALKWCGPEMDALVARKLKDDEWKWLRTDGPRATFVSGFLLEKNQSGTQ
jgi:hypothetical protein